MVSLKELPDFLLSNTEFQLYPEAVSVSLCVCVSVSLWVCVCVCVCVAVCVAVWWGSQFSVCKSNLGRSTLLLWYM